MTLRGEAGRHLVEVEALTRIFDVSRPWLNRLIEGRPRQHLRAVDRVSFSIARGETFALVGESGSGKSTIAKMLVGLLAPTSGTVRFDGIDIASREAARPETRRRIQMIFQDPFASLNPRWRVRRIVAEPLHALGAADGEDIGRRVDELLAVVGLSAADGAKFPHEFSGGQRQRIAIARALAARPDFIVCDEPTSALDVSVQAQILNLMKDLQDEFALTYLFISHDLSVVHHMADDIGVLYLGRLCEVAPGRDLFDSPRHPYTRMLLDAVPSLDAADRGRRPVEGEIPDPIDPPPGCAFHPRCPYRRDRCVREEPRLLPDGACRAACHGVAEGWPMEEPAKSIPALANAQDAGSTRRVESR